MKPKIKNIIFVIFIICIFISGIFTVNLAKKSITNNSKEIKEELVKPPENNTNNDNNSDIKENETENNKEQKMNNQNQFSNIENDNGIKMPNNMTSNSINNIYYILLSIEGIILFILITYLVMSNFNKKNIKETFKNKDKIIIFSLTIILFTIFYVLFNITYIKSSNSNSNNLPSNMNINSNITYNSDIKITEDTTLSDESYDTNKENYNAILTSGNINVTLSNINVSKTGDSSSGDNTSFYGINSAILAKDKAKLTISNATIVTDATGANGIFSYGNSNNNSNGTTVTVSDSTITTKKDNSGGIMTTGGGITNANNVTVNTYGVSSAAIRTDKGGGSVTVNNGTYQTYGAGSPSIYSTADIEVNNAKLISNASEGIVIEGKNKVTIKNTELIDTNNKLNGKSTTYKNIFLYQSMSGDADSGTSEFTSLDSTITTNKGDTFYVTNTKAIINLTNNKIINNDNTSYFLRVQKDSWGNSGSNGGDVTLNLSNQDIYGNISVDSISTLSINLSDNSYYEGSINSNNTAKEVTLNLDSTSKIELTGDCYVKSLSNEATDNSNINFNGYKLYVNGKSIN